MENNWEKISSNDALYGIASSKEKRNEKWELEEFFKVGEGVVAKLIENTRKYGYPKEKGLAVDFGCGAGRLSRFSSRHFGKVIGIDVSEGMIALAKKYNSEIQNVEYHVNKKPDLGFLESNSVDMIYTFHVLQHIPKRSHRINFIKEFQRIVKVDGLLVFHIPVFVPLKNRIQLKRRLFAVLNSIGASSHFLMNKLGLYPIHMTYITKNDIMGLFNEKEFALLELTTTSHKNGQVSATFYFKKVN